MFYAGQNARFPLANADIVKIAKYVTLIVLRLL